DLKLVFKNRRSILSPTLVTNKYFEFKGIPKNEMVYIVALKMSNQKQIKLAVETFQISGNDIEVILDDVASFTELEEKLQQINSDDPSISSTLSFANDDQIRD
ncbi:MAG: hypothetical protein AAF985_16025, partial [Bacteroidota bacterium]